MEEEPDLFYKTREEQGQLLQQVLAASDIDCEDERIPGEGGAKAGATRRTGNLGSMSGADDAVYYEFKKSNNINKHPLFKNPTEGPSDSWAILELQGDLKSHSETSFEGKFIGDLHFTKSNTPVLIIGHHLMYGKEAKLEKPFALLEKKRSDGGTEYCVKAVIKYKIIFKMRPKPIVAL
nr:unnamed protein product [Callosobruchus analis]